MDALVALIPILIASIVPPLVLLVRTKVASIVPDKWIPVLLPIGGGLLAGVAHLVGVDASILQTTSTDVNAWETVVQGILAGSASVGIHQAARQVRKAE